MQNFDRQEPEFDWSSKEQGLLLSSFFYGYIVTQLPGGWLAPRIGAAKLYGAGILATAVFTLLTPLIARQGLIPFVTIRILEGVFEVTALVLRNILGFDQPKFL